MHYARIIEMLEVTECAALAAGRWMGRGCKNEADQAAVTAMRDALNKLDIDGEIVIGEGERDEAPMLFIGEKLGRGGEGIDIAVDPIEGTNPTAYGQPNAMAVLAIAPRGTLLNAPDTYMLKVAAGPDAAGAVHIDASPTENATAVARALNRPVDDIVVCILERERNGEIIEEVRRAGARIRLIGDNDVHGAVATCIEGSGIHLYLGIGAAPEGVLACAAIKSLGGQFMGRFRFRDEADRQRASLMAKCDINGVLDMECLVNTDEAAFLATGITDGEMLRGVRYFGSGSRAHSLAIDGYTRTVRFIDSVYRDQDAESFRVRMS